jgi:DNA-binding beta-propeller fold protein YncE
MESVSYKDSGYWDSWGDRASDDTAGGYNEPPAQDTGEFEPPPEEEDDYLKLAPASTSSYVFIANPDRSTITRVKVPELSVVTVEVGSIPSTVLTTPDGKQAITLNEGADSVSILNAETLEHTELPIRDNLNRLSVSEAGKWAMAWYDPDVESLGESGGIFSFSEVSFVDIENKAHYPVVVGFGPKGIQWSEDGKRAVVVSDGALAVVDLINGLKVSLVALAEDPLDAPEAEEVVLAGDLAFVRQRGSETVALVDLVGLSVEQLAAGQDPSDMDVSPDGRQLAVVSRGTQDLYLIDTLNPTGAASVLPLPSGSTYGQLQYIGSGERAILYTTATLEAQYALWEVGTGEVVERPLVKPVAGVSISEDGSAMLVFHTEEDAPDADWESPFYGESVLTQVSLIDLRSNPLLLPAPVSSYAVSTDGRFGFFVMEEKALLEVLSFSTLLNEELELPSLPAATGVLPGTALAWVSQEHELGRISFYDAEAGSLDTITGFELNSGIDHSDQ